MRVVHDLAQAQGEASGRALTEVPLEFPRSAVTIGVFDSVHRGHQQLITGMLEAAHATHSVAIAITFDPHPAITLGRQPPPLLTTMEERAELLAAVGLDVLVVLPFTPATARTSATDFIEPLMRHLHMTQLWGGPDFALGHRCEGDIPFLRRLGAERGFSVHVVEPLVWEGALVSSSRVRAALRGGDIPQVTGCLGRFYRVAGVVVPPPSPPPPGGGTANLSPSPGRMLPAHGVYACLAHTEHAGTHPAVANVGTRPTSAGTSNEQAPVIKVHLLDFDAELYERVLTLDFVARLRDERTFTTPSALAAQIHEDIVQARVILRDSTTASEVN